VNAGEERRVDFALPSRSTISGQFCREVIADTMAMIVGMVHDTGGVKALGANIRAEWTAVLSQSMHVQRVQPVWIETIAGAGGRYALCGLLPGTQVTVRARAGQNRAASSQLPIRPGELRRLDLVLHAP
jgi:hypothetical protein